MVIVPKPDEADIGFKPGNKVAQKSCSEGIGIVGALCGLAATYETRPG
jgi:hypothetical protein